MKIVMLCRNGNSSAIVYNAINKEFPINKVIVEDAVSRKVFLKRRVKRLGLKTVIGQVAFSVLIKPLLKRSAKKRTEEITDEYGISFERTFMNDKNTEFVSSVNSRECIDILKRESPDVVLVNGTRIISQEVLECVDSTFINMHDGYTPKYRGCHGAYWAFYNNDAEHAGVTVHLVDKGIDTGGILYQDIITTTNKDNFVTYPIIQTAVGVKYEIKALRDIEEGELKTVKNDLPSELYSHPTFFQYLMHRIKYKVK